MIPGARTPGAVTVTPVRPAIRRGATIVGTGPTGARMFAARCGMTHGSTVTITAAAIAAPRAGMIAGTAATIAITASTAGDTGTIASTAAPAAVPEHTMTAVDGNTPSAAMTSTMIAPAARPSCAGSGT